MIQKTRDPRIINRIINSGSVRPFIDYRNEGMPLDFAAATDPAGRVVFLWDGDDAIGCFEMTGEREWQIHTLFGERCRGRRAIDTAHEMVAWMMPNWADRLWGATAVKNRKARWFNRQVGFSSIGFSVYEVEGLVEIFEKRAGA